MNMNILAAFKSGEKVKNLIITDVNPDYYRKIKTNINLDDFITINNIIFKTSEIIVILDLDSYKK